MGSIASKLTEEESLYKSLSAVSETEDHYFSEYQKFNPVTGKAGVPSCGSNVAFVIHGPSFLAHVQMMLGVVRQQDFIYCIGGCNPEFQRQMPCRVVYLPDAPLIERFDAMRESFVQNRIGTMIWVSVPLYASYAFSIRLAERQVFWALRFHPIAPGDLNLTAGERTEKVRMFHGKQWTVVHSPFNVKVHSVDAVKVERDRPEMGYLYGCLAREQKLVPPFLDAVAEILQSDRESAFLWTGRQESSIVRSFFRERSLSNRHRFMGWRNPDEYVNMLDCFLETFPLGGLTTLTAMGHGIPVVALRNEHSPIGSLEGFKSAQDASEYVRMAQEVKNSQRARQESINAGFRVFRDEESKAEQDKRNFWNTVLK